MGMIGKMLSGGHADGGLIRGPGTGKSDSIVSRLSDGEFVVRADATARNLPTLEAINSGRIPCYADGGLVGKPVSVSSGQGGVTNNHVSNVTVNANGGDHAANQDLAEKVGRAVQDSFRSMIGSEISKQRKPGGILYG
jgi:hypothetical protein